MQHPCNPNDIHYDLKQPCKDCPFLRGAEFHRGIFNDIPSLNDGLEAGSVIHTCHKTDPRTDSPEGQAYKGKLQHCAGLLTMMKNDPTLLGRNQEIAVLKKRWKPSEMKSANVFGSFVEFVKYYYVKAKEAKYI